MSFVDTNYIYREVNTAYLLAHRCTRENIVGHHIADILGKKKFEETVKPHFDLCMTGSQVRYQDWFEFPSIGRQFVDVIYSPFHDDNGSVAGVIVTARDFTEAHMAKAALQEARAHLDLIASNIEDVVWISDWKAQKVLYVNAAYERIWGRPLQDLYENAKNWLLAVHPDDRSHVQKAFKHLGRVGRFDEEYRILRPDGEVRWIRDRGFAVSGIEGSTSRTAGIAQDVTERKRFENALRSERQRLRAFLNNSAVVAWMKDADGRYVYLSDHYQERFQVRFEDWVGKTDFDIWPGETAEEFRRNDLIVLNGGRPIEAIEKAIKADGSMSWWLSNKFPFEDEAGKRYVGGLGVDVTESRWAEEERQKFVSLVEQSHEFIAMCDCDFKPSYVNPAGLRLVGLDNLEAAHRVRVPDTFFPEDQAFIQDEFLPRVQRDGHGEIEIRFRHFKTGEPIWMICNVCTIRDAGGAVVGWATVSRDITERKHAEEARHRLEEKLSHTQKLEAVGKLAAGMAHDVNSLLMVVLGNAQLIQSQLTAKGKMDTSLMAEGISTIVEAVDRGKILLDKLLTFGRVRSSKLGSVDLNAVVSNTLELIKSTIGRKVRIERGLAADLRRCAGDASQLQQVAMNLIMNADEAMPDGGRLTVQTENILVDDQTRTEGGRHKSPKVMLTVSDTGIGMDRKTQEQIFEPFFSTKPVNKGAGLGLSVVYGIVTQAGGHISVNSEIGKGTTFRIYLPALG